MSWYTDGYDDGKSDKSDELMVEIVALRLDAERYRWLRENVNNYELRDERDLLLPMDELDAAIDAAMKEEGK